MKEINQLQKIPKKEKKRKEKKRKEKHLMSKKGSSIRVKGFFYASQQPRYSALNCGNCVIIAKDSKGKVIRRGKKCNA